MNAALVHCPRCGGDFRCGAADATRACDCTTLTLDVNTLAALRERYAGCVCMACLLELQHDAERTEPRAATRAGPLRTSRDSG